MPLTNFGSASRGCSPPPALSTYTFTHAVCVRTQRIAHCYKSVPLGAHRLVRSALFTRSTAAAAGGLTLHRAPTGVWSLRYWFAGLRKPTYEYPRHPVH